MNPSTNKPESLERALIRSIDSSSLQDLTADIAEAGLDQLLEDGIVKDIPILGTLIRLQTSIGLVRDYIFTKKVARFLVGLAEINPSERTKFLKGVEQRNETEKLGETLLLLLDRLDDFTKPVLLAKIFRAYIQRGFDLSTFRRLAKVVDHLSPEAHEALRAFYAPNRQGSQIGGEYMSQLASVGLADIKFFSTEMAMVGGAFAPTELGYLYISIIDGAT